MSKVTPETPTLVELHEDPAIPHGAGFVRREDGTVTPSRNVYAWTLGPWRSGSFKHYHVYHGTIEEHWRSMVAVNEALDEREATALLDQARADAARGWAAHTAHVS